MVIVLSSAFSDEFVCLLLAVHQFLGLKWHTAELDPSNNTFHSICSLFVLSNETINIWSHLLGLMYFSYLTFHDNFVYVPKKNGTFEDHLVLTALLAGFQVRLTEIFNRIYCKLVTHRYQLNPFTPESDQCQNSPAASQEIWHHTVWRTWLFIAYSDEMWLYYKFSLRHSYNYFLKGWENTLFELNVENQKKSVSVLLKSLQRCFAKHLLLSLSLTTEKRLP